MELLFFDSLIKFWHDASMGEAERGGLNWTLTFQIEFEYRFIRSFTLCLAFYGHKKCHYRKYSRASEAASEASLRIVVTFDLTMNTFFFFDILTTNKVCNACAHLPRIEMANTSRHIKHGTKSANIFLVSSRQISSRADSNHISNER